MKSREQKRAEAKERQERYDKLSLDEKIKLIKSRPGNSDRELKRLKKQGDV